MTNILNNPFTYYGLYGWNNITSKDRKKYISQDANVYNKEKNYIHEIPIIGEEIINHLKNHFIFDEKLHYPNIESFKFVSYDKNCTEDDKIKIQEFINQSYLIDELDENKIISWWIIHFMRSMEFRGFNLELSQKYLSKFTEIAKKVYDELKLKEINLERIEALKKTIDRNCDNIHEIGGRETSEILEDRNKLLLEDILIREGEKQFLLGNENTILKYKNNYNSFSFMII